MDLMTGRLAGGPLQDKRHTRHPVCGPAAGASACAAASWPVAMAPTAESMFACILRVPIPFTVSQPVLLLRAERGLLSLPRLVAAANGENGSFPAPSGQRPAFACQPASA